jgi:hypothetical protein
MRSIIAGAGVAGAAVTWGALPRWAKLLVGGGLIALATIELVKDGNESYFSGSIFGGQAATGDAQAANPRKVEADLATGKPTTNAAATATAQFESLAADAKQKGVYADAAVESQAEMLAKKAKGIPLNSTEELRLKELRRQEADTRSAEWTANYLNNTLPNGDAVGDPFVAFGLLPSKTHVAPRRTQEASGGYVSSAAATVISPELKLRSCAYLNSDNSPAPQCTEVLRLTQGQRVTATNDVGNGWVKVSVRTNNGGMVTGFLNAKFLHFDGY